MPRGGHRQPILNGNIKAPVLPFHQARRFGIIGERVQRQECRRNVNKLSTNPQFLVSGLWDNRGFDTFDTEYGKGDRIGLKGKHAYTIEPIEYETTCGQYAAAYRHSSAEGGAGGMPSRCGHAHRTDAVAGAQRHALT